ncbi:MAG: DUF2946 domain-containing protein [Rhodoferax sp.]|nr:MAG: DUF2946 domain-containing protein [Rhodoferax sp.]
MQRLRNAQFLTRLVLVWFALFVGVATAAPILNPQSKQLVCSATGQMKLVASDDASDEGSSHIGLECVLCTGVSAPPPQSWGSVEPYQALSYALQTIESARIAAATAAPLPARGPPAIL